MNPELRFHPEAEKEVLGAAAWYVEHSPVAGQAFMLELDFVVQQILGAPERYPLSFHQTRRIVFPRFPFSVFIVLLKMLSKLSQSRTKVVDQGIGGIVNRYNYAFKLAGRSADYHSIRHR